MAEKTLNEPLSGSEIKEIILEEIKKRLDGDSTLIDDLAYAGFTARFDIKISFLRSIIKPTEIWGAAERKPGSETETEPAEPASISGSHTSNPSPDVERQNHDLPIPVQVQTPSGFERKKVYIEKPHGAKK